MNLKNFKIVKNRQRPDFCYAYEMYSESKDRKFSIFTMNGGKSFLASIVEADYKGKLVDSVLSENVDKPEDALLKFSKYLEGCTA